MPLLMKNKKSKPQDEFPHVPQEIRDKIPNIRSSAEVAEFTAQRDKLEGEIASVEQQLRNFQHRPDQADPDTGRKVATSSSIDAAAAEYLRGERIPEFQLGIDQQREVLRNRKLVLERALQRHNETHTATWGEAARKHLPTIKAIVREIDVELIEVSKMQSKLLKRKKETLQLAKRQGHGREFTGLGLDMFEEKLLGLGLGEPLDNYILRREEALGIEK